MGKSRIEIIALNGASFYSVGTIEVTSKGEVYAILKTMPVVSKLSRHVSGQTRVENEVIGRQVIRRGPPLKEFLGLEYLHTMSFRRGSLEEVFRKYELKKGEGIFCVDMRAYRDSAFNIVFYILTEEGLIDFYKQFPLSSKKQMYVFYDSHPKIGLIALDIKPRE
jgi:hypothetical protein